MPQDDKGRLDDDLDPGHDDLDAPQSRFSMMTGTLVALGVVTLMIFAGVIWYAYNAGVKMAADGPVIVEAEPGETKVKPEDPGGENFEHQDKTVYDKIDGSSETAEQLLPGAEEPMDKPEIISPSSEDLPPEGQPKIVRIPEGEDSVSAAPDVVAPEIPDPMAGAKNETAQSGSSPQLPPLEYNVMPGEPVDPATVPPEAPEVAAVDDKTSPAPAAPKQEEMVPETTGDTVGGTATKPAAGKFVLQLGAYRTQEAAVAGWKLFNSKHEAILGPIDNYISEADLGEKGKFYRLQIGPYPDRASAGEKCTALKNAGANCLIVAR